MKKFAKIALIIFGTVVVIVTVAALLAPRLADPNQYKNRISAIVKGKTGRELTIAGDISLSVFPWLGAEIGTVELGNAPGFEAETFAALRQMQVKVKLLPLLSKKVEASVITIEGMVLNLERDPGGRTNWEDLLKTSAPPEEKPESASSETRAIGGLVFDGLDIRDARITWTDRQSDTTITVKNLGLRTSAVNLVDPVEVSLRFELDTGPLGLAGTFGTDTRIEFDLSGGHYAAKDLSLTADLSGEAIPGGSTMVTIGGNAAVDAGFGTFNLEGLQLDVAGLNLAGYAGNAFIEASGSGNLDGGSLRLDSLGATVTLASGEERITAELSAGAEADISARRFTLSDLALNLPEFTLKGLKCDMESTGTGSFLADLSEGEIALDTPALEGTLSGDTVPDGETPVALDFNIRGNLNRQTFNVTPVTISLANITATANIEIDQLKSGPRVNGTLAVAPFNLRDLLIRMGMDPPDMADTRALSVAEISMNLLTDGQAAAIDNLSLCIDDTTLSGALTVTNFGVPETNIDLSLDRIQLEKYLPPGEDAGTPSLLSDVSLKGKISANTGFKVFHIARLALAGKLDQKLAVGLSAADTRVDLDKEKISVESLSLNAGKMELQTQFELVGFNSEPSYTASIQMDAVNLREVLTDLDLMPETADTEAMSAVKFNASLEGTPDAVSVSSLDLHLDDTRITGNAYVILSPAPAYGFDIVLDSIDVNRYLPPLLSKNTTGKNTASTNEVAASASPLPVEPLRNLALEAKIAVGKLKIKKLSLSNIEFQANASEGLLVLDPIRADLYEGASSASIRLDARGRLPELSVKTTLAGIQSEKLLKDLQGKAVMTGFANAELDLASAGADTDALTSSLGGTVAFTFTDGSIKGVDIVGKICNTLLAADAGSLKTENLVGAALQMLTQRATDTETTTSEADTTSFSEISGSMVFSEGVGTSDDLSLKSPLLRIKGAGDLDLSKQHLNYDATASLVKSCQGQGGQGTDDLKNIPIPVTISGPFTQLKVRPNLTAGILEILARKQQKNSEETQSSASDQEATSDSSLEKPQTVEDAVTGILQNLLKKQ